MRNFIRKSVFAAIALTALTIIQASTAALYAQNYNQEQNYIEVSTRVEKQITPDMIYINIVIREADSKTKNYLETKEKEMIKALQSIKIDVEKNRNFERGIPFDITAEGARVATWIIPTDEEYMIAIDTQRLASK